MSPITVALTRKQEMIVLGAVMLLTSINMFIGYGLGYNAPHPPVAAKPTEAVPAVVAQEPSEEETGHAYHKDNYGHHQYYDVMANYRYEDYWDRHCVTCQRQLEGFSVGGEPSIIIYSDESILAQRFPCCHQCWTSFNSETRKMLLARMLGNEDECLIRRSRFDLFHHYDDKEMERRAELMRAVDKPGKRFDANFTESAPGVLYRDAEGQDNWSQRINARAAEHTKQPKEPAKDPDVPCSPR